MTAATRNSQRARRETEDEGGAARLIWGGVLKVLSVHDRVESFLCGYVRLTLPGARPDASPMSRKPLQKRPTERRTISIEGNAARLPVSIVVDGHVGSGVYRERIHLRPHDGRRQEACRCMNHPRR